MLAIGETVRDLDRLRQILQVLVRYGFGELLARTDLAALLPRRRDDEAAPPVAFAARLRLALEELGPTFVKLGQILSTRPDLLPADVVAELKHLQDRVPPVAVAEVRREIEAALGAGVEEVFATFDDRPLAAASVGQVHRATLRRPDGTLDEVVVKVQRPGIAQIVERDLSLLHLLARLVERAIPESRVYAPTGLVAEFDRAITAELDYGLEADNAERFARNFEGHPEARFPLVHRAASGRRVVTLEFLRGQKVYDAVAAGASGPTIAERAVGILAKMIFEDGFFHADPHPGNLLILGPPDAPVIGLLDLGLVGRLPEETRDKAIDLLLAAAGGDHRALADALLALGRPRRAVDRAAFQAEVSRLAERHLGQALARTQASALLRDLIEGAVRFEIDMPTELLMLGKAMLTVEGIGKELHPELDVYATLRPHLMRLLWRRFHPARLGQDLLRGAARLGEAATDLPPLLRDALAELRRGELTIRTTDPRLPRVYDRLGRRIFSGLVTVALVGAGTALRLAGGRADAALGSALLAAGLAVLLAHWLLDFRLR